MFGFFIFLFIFPYFCKSGNPLEDDIISNPIQVFKRQNRVLFVVSQNCSNEIYQNLVQGFVAFEEKAKDTTTRITNFITDLSFGGIYNNTLKPFDSLKFINSCSNCFNLSKVKNVAEVASVIAEQNINKTCPKEIKKYYTLIVSDHCLKNLNINLNNECPGDFQQIGLMLPTKEDVEKCKKLLLESANQNQNSMFLKILTYNQQEIDGISDDSLSYIDANIIYHSTMASSKINLFVFVKNEIRIKYYALWCKLTRSKFERCMKTGEESAIGHFQFGTNNQQKQQHEMVMAAPLNFDSADDLITNYGILLNQSSKLVEVGCERIMEHLTNLNKLDLDQSDEQYNVLVLEDSHSKCLEGFSLEWNNTNRHLEIIVIYNDTIKNDYSKFITFPKNSLNHLIFYKDDWDTDFNLYFDPLCTSETNWKIIWFRFFMHRNVSVHKKPKPDYLPMILIILAAIIFLFLVIAVIVYLKMKKSAKIRKNWIKEKVEKVAAFEVKNFKNSNQYWSFLIDNQDVSINYNEILGRGSRATVYLAYYRQPFRLLSNLKAAAKVTKNVENSIDSEFVDELNALKILKDHGNIVSLIGWTMFGDDTVIVTELAESNLFEYIQTNRYHSSFMKWSLQILWQISSALEYITGKELIHRDVACRNILMFNKTIAKLTDFGLCCKSDESGIFKDTTHRLFPLKWLSIEALNDRIFSEKSDVWAFGILCFEVFSYGEIPYSTLSHSEMIEFLEAGNRLPKPSTVAPHIYDLVLLCWKKEPQNRPNFYEIRKNLEVVLEYGYLPLDKNA